MTLTSSSRMNCLPKAAQATADSVCHEFLIPLQGHAIDATLTISSCRPIPESFAPEDECIINYKQRKLHGFINIFQFILFINWMLCWFFSVDGIDFVDVLKGILIIGLICHLPLL